MALNLSRGRRRWTCRASRRGGKGGAGCRHFHVHYHVPHQVWAFSPLRLPARFSLLRYLLILPVLFFAMLAFLVCFGWFTLVYFLSSLWSKDNDRELCANDAGEPLGEDGRDERAVKRVTQFCGDSGPSEVCIESQKITEGFEDGFSEESRLVSRMPSSGICVDGKEHADEDKIVKEVVMFESNKGELKSFAELDGSSEKHQQVMDIPIDCFLEQPNNREFSTSLSTAKLLNVPYGEDFIANRKDMEVLCSSEILEFIDKHDTAEIIVNSAVSDLEVPEVPSPDDSASYGPGGEHRKEINQEQSTAELSYTNNVASRLAEAIIDECQETQNLVIEHNNKLHENDSMDEEGKLFFGLSDETLKPLCETAGSPLYSVCENESETVAASKAKRIKQEQSTAELSVNSVDNRIAETNLDEWKETKNSVVEHNNKLAEDDSMDEDRKQTVSISDVAYNSLCETAGLPFDSLWENESETVGASNTPFHEATSDQDGGLEEELIRKKRAESSTSASDVCDFANKHWRIIEQLGGFANEGNIQEDSQETSALQRVKAGDVDMDHNCASMGASRTLPLVRRSPSQWWNLCGVLDAFAGGED
ncbi:unnamed protein product [Urochloa humidicola]